MQQYQNSGLLFYLSGSSFTADFARGRADTAVCLNAEVREDAVQGGYLECGKAQKLSWKAPGNIYAERGTLSFFWRSRFPVGPTEFPVFRVSYADHSSWDACWLRIDYNGSGFEAMVTDIDLSRARVAAKVDPFPAPEEWVHLALAWDENWGIKFYVNGAPAAEEYRPATVFAGLGQFGPHGRIVSEWNTTNDYNFIRGGDLCKLAIHDHMLSAEEIAALARGELPEVAPYFADMANADDRSGFLRRSGFDAAVPAIPDSTVVRKAEVHDAYDLKRWWWKGCDGIRETTWPGVYNRSRLKGRNDYFQLPDWDCYSISGKTVTFTAPDEPYNHIEISGSAHGVLELVDKDGAVQQKLFDRAAAERSVHRIEGRSGGFLRFTNEEIEEPIGDFSLFSVTEGSAPAGVKRVAYTFAAGYAAEDAPTAELAAFIKGRYTAYERHIMTAVPAGAAFAPTAQENAAGGYPFVNVIIPYEFDEAVGLDGIELTLPARSADTAYAVQIKDPVWYYRNLAHFTFTAEAGCEKKIFFDLRDRILPENRCLYLTVAASDAAFGPAALEGATLTCIYKSAEAARAEHVADRFTQVRDLYGHLVEEQPNNPAFEMYNRFYADINDLLRIDPDHKPGQYYYYDKAVLSLKGASKVDFVPDYQTEQVPEGVPAWAFKQVEYLRQYKYLINWWIDNRQIENGELGGGLSDDGDFTAMWVGLAEMGCDHEKIIAAMELCHDAFYEQGMFTNGLPSIQADELHAAEEGLISLGQCLTVDFANPKLLERAMETARSIDWITGINKAGHRHFKSFYYSGSKMAPEEPWNCQQSVCQLALSPAWFLPRFNGNPTVRRLLTELADGLAAHFKPEEGIIHSYVRFEDDAELPFYNRRRYGDKMLLYPAYKLTGNKLYYDIAPESNGHGVSCDGFVIDALDIPSNYGTVEKAPIAEAYEKLCFTAGVRMYYNTEGHPWIDRVYFDPAPLQIDRLGGIAHTRSDFVYPHNRISWRFANKNDDEKLGILVPVMQEDHVKILVYNMAGEPVTATIRGCEVLPGIWQVTQGIDTTGDDTMDSGISTFETPFERSTGFALTFAPGVTTVVELKLTQQGRGYWDRCDLGVGKEDLHFYAHGLNVTIHSLGALDSPEVTVALKDRDGNTLKTATLPPLPAPTDLWPRWREVSFNLHGIESLEGCYVEIDPEQKLCEITRENNIVTL